MILTRQNVPTLEGTATADGVAQGAYTLVDCVDPDVILVSTGSEVSVCVNAAASLGDQGIAARVVSMPCWELFAEMDLSYQQSVLLPGVPKLSVEAGVTLGWERWADLPIGIDRFGASAPGPVVLDKLGMNADNVAALGRVVDPDLGAQHEQSPRLVPRLRAESLAR